jgi:antibiotic biosynthesis monooxygenase (ABM) superfamily enzyme
VVPWKSAVAVLVAIVPVSQVLLATRLWLYPDLNAAVATLMANIVTVAVLTWLLMPPITRRLKHWLRR